LSPKDATDSNQQVRAYLHSTRFRVSSWLCAVLMVVSFFVAPYRLWCLYTAAGMSLIAMLPVLRVIPYRRNLDLEKMQERQRLLFVVLYVAAIIVATILYALYRTKH
jgi:hypothetical protein